MSIRQDLFCSRHIIMYVVIKKIFLAQCIYACIRYSIKKNAQTLSFTVDCCFCCVCGFFCFFSASLCLIFFIFCCSIPLPTTMTKRTDVLKKRRPQQGEEEEPLAKERQEKKKERMLSCVFGGTG